MNPPSRHRLPPPPARRRRPLLLTEVVLGAGLLAVFASCVFAALGALHDARAAAARQQQALLVLDNTVERLAAEPSWDAATVERLLRAEFAASALGTARGVRATCEPQAGHLALAVVDARGKPLGRLRLPTAWTGGPSR